jgi:hypothetical protein
MLSLTSILIHSEAVPEEAKTALRAAHEAPPSGREEQLEQAARTLYHSTDLECGEVRDLVGLPEGSCR